MVKVLSLPHLMLADVGHSETTAIQAKIVANQLCRAVAWGTSVFFSLENYSRGLGFT